ncbi:MAG: DciA family protein [Acetobacteraceae bacterium]|nr:DciA family protein [Acetobacteraceae bacterium]
MRGGRPVRLDGVLEGVVGRLGLRSRLREELALEEWPRVAGPELCRHAWPVRISQGVLHVQTSSPAWAREASFLKPELRSRLNQRLGQEVVKDIRFSAAAGCRHRPGTGGPVGPSAALAAPPLPAPCGRSSAAQTGAQEVADAEVLAHRWERFLAAWKRAREGRLGRGYRRCRGCGAPHEPGLELCPACAREERGLVRRRVEALLAHCPWLDREGLQRELGVQLGEEEVDGLKQDLDRRWEADLLALASAGSVGGGRAQAMALAMLRTGRRPEEMDLARCAEALGEPLAGWLLKQGGSGVVPAHRS